MTGSDVAAAVRERKTIAAIVNVSRVIAPPSYHFVIAVGRPKEAQCGMKLKDWNEDDDG